MAETIVQMTPMLVLGALIAAWLAEAVSRTYGYGFICDMVLGLAGSLIVGASVWLLLWRDAGMTAMLLVGFIAAALAIIAQRGVWPSGRVPAEGGASSPF